MALSAHVWYDMKILAGDTVPGKREREFDLVGFLDTRKFYFVICLSHLEIKVNCYLLI